MLIKCKKIEFRVTPFLIVVIALFYYLGYLKEYLIVYFSMMLHEFAHIIVASKFYKRKVEQIRLLPMGFTACLDESEDRKGDLHIYASGPLLNLVVGILGIYFGYLKDGLVNFCSEVNIWLAIFNMIPILPLDGGKIINDVLKNRLGFGLATLYMQRLSVICLVIVMFLGILQIYCNKYNFSLLLIGIYIFTNMKLIGQKEEASMNIMNILYRCPKIRKKKIYPARDLVVMQNAKITEVIKVMDFDKFHIIYVLDDELKLVRMLTEADLLKGIEELDTDFTLRQFTREGRQFLL